MQPVSLQCDVTPDVIRTRLMADLRSQNIPLASLNACFRWLRKGKQRPPAYLRANGKTLSLKESHEEWCKVFRLQAQGPIGLCERHEQQTRRRWLSLRGLNIKNCGKGDQDYEMSSSLVYAALAKWKGSRATTPLLLPRAAFLAKSEEWDSSVICLLQLAGPAKWALRANLWRSANIDVTFKSGDATNAGNWRFLCVRDQMGLLQEGCFALIAKPCIWPTLMPGQSGYTPCRSVDDPVLVMHELTRMVLDCFRCLFYVLGDFRKAYPSVWRADLLLQVQNNSGLRAGCMTLLDDILSRDDVVLPLSGGRSWVRVVEGLPEGGSIGPLTYPSLPDSLTRLLQQHMCGFASTMYVPAAWSKHRWVGSGTPCPDLVDWLLTRLRNGQELLSSAFLAQHPNAEASALRALDLLDDNRIIALFHADDPVFLASSVGELQRVLNLVSGWMHDHGAVFHVSGEKTVVFGVGVAAATPDVSIKLSNDPAPHCLMVASIKRWLGFMWDMAGGTAPTMRDRITKAAGVFASLVGFVREGAIPLPYATPLFIAKVDSVLSFGRWLYIFAEGAAEKLEELEDRWCRALCDVAPWSNAFICRKELGIWLTASARAVLDVARRRAKLLMLPTGDLYKRISHLV